MTIRAVFIDLGGVIVRTEYQAPRQHLADRLGMEYEDLVKKVFECETSRQASIGQLSEDEHWAAVIREPASAGIRKPGRFGRSFSPATSLTMPCLNICAACAGHARSVSSAMPGRG